MTTLPPFCAVVMKSGNLNFLEPSGSLQACNGTALNVNNTQYNINIILYIILIYNINIIICICYINVYDYINI